MFKNHFKSAWRNIAHQKLVSSINIGSLSIAMAAVVLILIWVQYERSFDKFQPDADRVYLLKNKWQVDKNQLWIVENSFYPLANAIQKDVPEAALVTRMNKIRKDKLILVVGANRFRAESAINVDTNWFKVFHYDFIKGNAHIFFANPKSIILTESKAKQLFGSTDIVNKKVQIDSSFFPVSAVIKDNPLNSSFQFDALLPFYGHDYETNDWLYTRCKTFVKLRSSSDTTAATKKINAIVKANSTADGNMIMIMLPLLNLHFENDFTNTAFEHVNRSTTTIFSVIAFLLLLTAAINYVNLTVARTSIRAKEMSIRKISGASRHHLFSQMMAESITTSFIALGLSILIIYISFPLLTIFSGKPFVFNPFSKNIFFILSGTLLSIILLTGVYPALLLSSFKPIGLFNGKNILGIKDNIFKKSMLAGQFAFAVFMIVAAIIVYQQLVFIQKQDVSYNRAQILTVHVPWNAVFYHKEDQDRETILATIKQELLSKSQIDYVSRTGLQSLVNENYSIAGGVDWEGKPDGFEPQYISYSVDADMDNIMHFKMVAGRWFDKNDLADAGNTVLNETAVKKFELKEPIIGKRFNKGVIIGIVKDFFHADIHNSINSLVIETGGPKAASFAIQTKPGMAKETLQAAEKIWKSHFPGTFFEYSFADEEFAKLYADDQKALSFTLIFSGLSILICCMGLLGMTIFMTERRTREIGIRKVLGATVTGIMLLLSRDFLKLIVISILIAFPIAWWAMTKWLQHYAYRIPINWWVFFMAAAAAIIIALLSAGFQSFKAAIANPVKSMRSE